MDPSYDFVTFLFIIQVIDMAEAIFTSAHNLKELADFFERWLFKIKLGAIFKIVFLKNFLEIWWLQRQVCV